MAKYPLLLRNVNDSACLINLLSSLLELEFLYRYTGSHFTIKTRKDLCTPMSMAALFTIAEIVGGNFLFIYFFWFLMFFSCFSPTNWWYLLVAWLSEWLCLNFTPFLILLLPISPIYIKKRTIKNIFSVFQCPYYHFVCWMEFTQKYLRVGHVCNNYFKGGQLTYS